MDYGGTAETGNNPGLAEEMAAGFAVTLLRRSAGEQPFHRGPVFESRVPCLVGTTHSTAPEEIVLAVGSAFCGCCYLTPLGGDSRLLLRVVVTEKGTRASAMGGLGPL